MNNTLVVYYSLFETTKHLALEIAKQTLGSSNSSTFVAVTGFIISIPVAAASMGSLYGYLGNMINLVLPPIVSPLYVIISFAAIMLTYQLSKALRAGNFETVSMSEALKAGTE